MWYGIGVKMAQEPMEEPQPGMTAGDMASTAADIGLPTAAIGSALVPPSVWTQMGQRLGGPAAGRALGMVGKKLPFGLSIAAGIPSAISTRHIGGDVPATAAEGATPQEAAYVQGARAGDQQAWRHLPAGYAAQNNLNAISGLINAPLAVIPHTAALTWAGQIPEYLSSTNRAFKGDPRESFYNPEMLKHMFDRPVNTPVAGRGAVRRFWEDELRPTGNVLNQGITKPIQSMASGLGILGQDVRNVWNDLRGKPTQPAGPAPVPPAPTPVPRVAAVPVRPPVRPAIPKSPSTVT